jgi:hypothetical protein
MDRPTIVEVDDFDYQQLHDDAMQLVLSRYEDDCLSIVPSVGNRLIFTAEQWLQRYPSPIDGVVDMASPFKDFLSCDDQ